MTGERQTETHQAEEWWTLTVCSHCGEQAGANSHGHSDARDWFWRKVVVVPEVELARVRAEKDRAVAEVQRLFGIRNEIGEPADLLARAEAAEARVAELEAERDQAQIEVERLGKVLEQNEEWREGYAYGVSAAVVQDRIDRAMAERTAEIVAFMWRLDREHYNNAGFFGAKIEHKFPVPARTQEASDGD